MEVSGDLPLAETAKARWALGARLYGWWRYMWIVMVLALMACGLAMFFLFEALSRRPQPIAYEQFELWAILLLYLGFGVGYVLACRRYWRWLVSRSTRARGYKDVIPIRFAVAEDGFHVTAEFARTHVSWPGVSEIAPMRKRHWLFITAGSGFVIPRRFFAGVEAERAFIRAALGHLGEAARARSKEAAAFVGAGQA